MPLEELREPVPILNFPRQTFVSLLVFAAAWEMVQDAYRWKNEELTFQRSVESIQRPAARSSTVAPESIGADLAAPP